ncbi:HD-domain/PDEase-like protein [Agrocybe pediades]|nr:HD-domain/PDEase-like protein [Agrocybe pediades]
MEYVAYQSDSEGELENNVVRHIKDPIHDYIPISKSLARFIDTKQFQRLRNIKQLGTSSYVWPSACHTRFEHCLGVAFLARQMATHLQKSQPKLQITDRDVDCVEIAGLCHDLGHGPWSHVWDGMFIPRVIKDRKWRHEDGSEMMFDALVKDHKINISEEDQKFVKALIAGEHSRTPHEKPFLFDIVANKRNGLDVDKFDYIHRDSQVIGEPIHLSLVRLVNSARVLDNQICYNIKDANHIYDICVARFKLHKTFYNHKTAKAIEYMIIDALIAADPYLKISGRIWDPKKFLYLTDSLLETIESSEAPELEEARNIVDRIRTRDTYKDVDFKVIDWPMIPTFRKEVTPANILKAIMERQSETSQLDPPTLERSISSSTVSSSVSEEDPLDESDIIVDIAVMHYGMQDKNPVDKVHFYSKRHPNRSGPAQAGVYSNLIPAHFAEGLLRVYTKKTKYFGIVQAGYRDILRNLEKRLSTEEPVEGMTPLDPMAPTPPASEPPTTPKAHSRNLSFTFAAAGNKTTPFSDNSFTTVSPSFAPASPTQGSRKVTRRKRSRDEASTSVQDAPSKKRK